MRRLRIFTWHVHGSYLYYLSKVPHDFYVPVKPGRPFGYGGRTDSYDWPENVIEVPADKVRELNFDCVLFQSHDNWLVDQYECLSEQQRSLPKLFLEHNTPKGMPTDTPHPVDDPDVLLVHVTHYNDLTWDSGRTPTCVIEHGVMVPEDVRCTHVLERGLVVMNNIMTRGRRMGGDVFERARGDVPLDLVGMGWREVGGLGEVRHSDLATFSAPYRFHFSPVRFSSLALSLCEAMMIGQPVVGLATTELVTVVENGVSGFIDTRVESVIDFMKLLLREKGLAQELGRGARRKALERFDIERFRNDWIKAFAHVTGSPSALRKKTSKTSNEPKARVAMISEHASPVSRPGGVDSGGQNVYVAQVARHLSRMGYEVDIFTRKDDERLPDVLPLEDGVRVINVNAGPARYIRKEEMLEHIPMFTDKIEEFCRWQKARYDICHANFWMSGLAAADLKKRLGLPFVVTFHALGRVRRVHQGDADQFPDRRFEAEDRIVEEADHIIAECPQDNEDLRVFYGADPRRTTIIPCGFDPQEVYPIDKRTARLHLGLDPEVPIFLQLGRMVPRKGVDLAIRGFARTVHHHGCPARLLIVGGESEIPDPLVTPEIGRLLKIAHEEGVSDLVTFTGRKDRDQLKFFYSAAEAFITTPWYEPFGITPVEAMACATPVVGTKVGGIKFSVVDGETGFLIAPNDIEDLGRKLARILGEGDLQKRLSQGAFHRAQSLFQWDKVATQVASIYEWLIHYRRGENQWRNSKKKSSWSPAVAGD